MRWTTLTLAGALSLSGASASVNAVLRAKFNMDVGASLYENEIMNSAPHKFQKRNETTPNLFARFLTHLDPRQTEGRCGAEFNGARCPDNQCCSGYGYCGNEFEFCGEIVGCQPQYGRCGDAPAPPPSSSPTPTPTPTPSSSSIQISSSTVVPPSSTVSPPLPSGTLIVSTNGQCGNVTTCAGSPFGGCCSQFYFCGSSAAYCGTGCRPEFGNCGAAPPVSSSSVPAPPSSAPPSSAPPTSTPTPTPTPTPSSSAVPSSSAAPVPTNVSTDGRCGENQKTCTGSTFGRCCSDYGWCGNQDDYCRVTYGCQPQWGTCGSAELLEFAAM